MRRVMLVDDSQLILRGLECIMDWEANGYLIAATAINGRQALEKLEKMQIDILLTDIKMPVMDGLELIRLVRARFPHIRIAVLSAYDDFSFVRTAFLLGAQDYLLKQEYDRETILAILNKFSLEVNLEEIERMPEQNVQGRYMLLLQECIEKHYAECDLRAEDVAEYMGISAGWMGKTVRQETGMSFSDYLNRYRISRAQELLIRTSLKVYEVAEQTGYGNVEHFGRVFKRITGISPGEYASGKR